MGTCPDLKRKIESKGKAMSQDKRQHHMMFGTLILLAIFVGLTLFVVSIVQANPAPDGAAISATFRTKCPVCHGQDVGGSEVGKSMNVPDLRSPAVQKLPDAETCSSHCQRQGRNALIQEFAQRGSDSLDGFLRSLAASKEIGRTLYTAVVATGNGFSSFGREAVEKGGSS